MRVHREGSYSNDQGPDCVEVALAPATVHIRDSRDKDRARLTVGESAFRAARTPARAR
ncbi:MULTISPECIES: DUF397 domain-containing protein [Streptomyces]|uniref:DUF397 domain-containing protein n=1 Tax=Streptomyces TaxID=1883 RepID=UPI0016001D4E|nr:DUF397 domain-containing protein [Streptomyces murinus]